MPPPLTRWPSWFSLVDLGVEAGQQHEISGRHPTGHRGVRAGQSIPGADTHRSGDRGADLDAAGAGEPDDPRHPQRGQPVRVGEMGGDQPADSGAERVGQRQRHAREAAVQLTEQLVLGRGPREPRRRRCATQPTRPLLPARCPGCRGQPATTR